MAEYDRYSEFRSNGYVKSSPCVKIPVKSTDKYENYTSGVTRFDILSYNYYGNANYGWLIMLANPHLSGLEFETEQSTMIRIPFPLSDSMNDYIEEVNKYIKING